MNKLRTCTFSRSIRADDLGKSRPAQSIYGSREAVIISLSHIEREKMHVVTDGIKISGQNKSIDIGPLNLQIEFEAIWPDYSYRKLCWI